MNTQLKSILAKRLAKKGKKLNGFTLIELMVVVAIVGVLTAVGLPQLNAAQDKAKVAAARQTLSNGSKECSIELITSGTVPTFATDGTNAGVVYGTCEGGEELGIVAEDTDATTLTLTISDDGIPGDIS